MRRLTDDSGSVAIIVALMLTALMGVAALAIDVGAMLTQRGALQNGADASAIAVAKRCAENVAGPLNCNYALLNGTAGSYLGSNTPSTSTATIDAGLTALSTSHGGRLGTVSVGGSVNQSPIFSRMLNGGAPLTVRAAATAHWAPAAASDAVFPLVACIGALPPPNTAVTRVVDPSVATPGVCNGASAVEPFGWVSPDLPNCTVELSTSPRDYKRVYDADNEPWWCGSEIDDLHDAIAAGASAQDRTRTLAVYNANQGFPSSRPIYSLVAFEFIGAKLDGRTSHVPSGAWSPQCDLATAAVRCIEGVVRYRLAPTNGPLVTASQASRPGIADTTILDVRLVD